MWIYSCCSNIIQIGVAPVPLFSIDVILLDQQQAIISFLGLAGRLSVAFRISVLEYCHSGLSGRACVFLGQQCLVHTCFIRITTTANLFFLNRYKVILKHYWPEVTRNISGPCFHLISAAAFFYTRNNCRAEARCFSHGPSRSF